MDAIVSMVNQLHLPLSLLPRRTDVACRASGRYQFPNLPERRGDNDFELFVPPCYLLGNVIGEGEFATVKLAYNMRTKKHVAIKCFKPRSGRYMLVDEQILRELMAAKGLVHEHIVHMHEAIMYGNRVFLVMEHCSNGDLRRYINKNGPLNESHARDYFGQICLGIKKMHSLDLVHRDIKLENILIDSNFVLKVGDLGCARRQMDKRLNTITGSYAYGAPEVVRGDRYDGKKADVWSLGIILFAMVQGKLPYTDKGSLKQMLKKRSKPPKYPSHLSASCRELLSGMLCFEPSVRLTIEEVISHPWLSNKED